MHSVHLITKWRWKGVGVGQEKPTKNYVKLVLHLRWVGE